MSQVFVNKQNVKTSVAWIIDATVVNTIQIVRLSMIFNDNDLLFLELFLCKLSRPSIKDVHHPTWQGIRIILSRQYWP